MYYNSNDNILYVSLARCRSRGRKKAGDFAREGSAREQCVYIYIYIYIYTHIMYMCMCMCVHVHIYTHVYMCMCVCIYIYIYICITDTYHKL